MERNKVGFIGGKFLPLHQGHVYAILTASNQVNELYVILSSSEKRDKELCQRDGIKYIPTDVRLAWLGESFNSLDNIKILHIEDSQGDSDYNWEDGARRIKQAIGKPINFIFSSEPSYSALFKKLYPNSKHITIDKDRKKVPISATELRKNLYSNWDKLPAPVQAYFTKRVAIVGTESCGKTTLAKKLAKFYNTAFVPEVGREYCLRFGNQLTPEMFDSIAMEHFLLQERKARASNKVLLVDSDAVITQYYLDMYFKGKSSSLIEEIVKKQRYDLVIYLEPDIQWKDDGLRFAGEEETRKANNERLKRMYQERGIAFVSVSGSYDERFNRARELVDLLFRRLG